MEQGEPARQQVPPALPEEEAGEGIPPEVEARQTSRRVLAVPARNGTQLMVPAAAEEGVLLAGQPKRLRLAARAVCMEPGAAAAASAAGRAMAEPGRKGSSLSLTPHWFRHPDPNSYGWIDMKNNPNFVLNQQPALPSVAFRFPPQLIDLGKTVMMNLKDIRIIHTALVMLMFWLAFVLGLPTPTFDHPSFAGFTVFGTEEEWTLWFLIAGLIGAVGIFPVNTILKQLSTFCLATSHLSVAYCFARSSWMNNEIYTAIGPYGLYAALGYYVLYRRVAE